MTNKTRKYKLRVIKKDANQRLDLFLASCLPNYSRQFLRDQIKTDHVTIDGKINNKPKVLVRVGQTIEAVLDSPAIQLIAQPIKLDIIYQDKDLVVINKPAGMVMHPAGQHKQDTLANALRYKFKTFYLVHRLDKDTSGIVLVARNEKTKIFLSRLFEQRKIKKIYTALLKGKITPQEAYINLPIKRGYKGSRFEVLSGGRQAESYYQVKKYINSFSLVEVQLKTGRTHQIRVHFKALGYPVVGDKLYGIEDTTFSRQFLHASYIEFVDWLGHLRQFTAPLPKDLSNFLKHA